MQFSQRLSRMAQPSRAQLSKLKAVRLACAALSSGLHGGVARARARAQPAAAQLPRLATLRETLHWSLRAAVLFGASEAARHGYLPVGCAGHCALAATRGGDGGEAQAQPKTRLARLGPRIPVFGQYTAFAFRRRQHGRRLLFDTSANNMLHAHRAHLAQRSALCSGWLRNPSSYLSTAATSRKTLEVATPSDFKGGALKPSTRHPPDVSQHQSLNNTAHLHA
eukprot:2935818-Pleurochrysis_carterae.AAC.4